MKKSKHRTVFERYKHLEEIIDHGSLGMEVVLKKALNDKSPRIRTLAAETVGRINVKTLLSSLLNMVGDPSPIVRMSVIESVGKLSPPKPVAFDLAPFLNDPDDLVRLVTAEALGEIKNRKVLRELENALSDSSHLVRAYAADAIGRIGTNKSIQILTKYVDSETNERVKVDLYYALFSLGDRDYLSQLIDLINSNDLETRCAVADALQSISLIGETKTIVLSLLKKRLILETTNFGKDCIEECIIQLSEVV